MKRYIALASTLLIGAMSATSAQAAERHGWYFGLEGGLVKVNDTDLVNWGYTRIQFENGWAGLAEVGYALDGRWRIELEGGYRRNDLDKVNGVSVGLGDLRNYTGFVNAIWDAPISQKWALSLGAGAGVDDVRFSDPFGVHDSDTVFAAQGIAGLDYQMSDHWDLFLNYRYLWADSPTFSSNAINCLRIGCRDSMDVVKHTITIGFRYGYESPEAPPPEPPAPPPAEAPPAHFIIFFGFNKCNITSEADRVLSEAVDAAKSMGSAAVTIVGHTDTSGSTRYNQRLSECRANASKSNMVGKGIPESSISASGKGETELMVQTGDGVKEPQNRRATIDLH